MYLPQFESYLPQVGPDHSQVFARFYEPRLYEEPEERLMRAIFEDLINVLAGNHGNIIQDGRHNETYNDAVRDLLSDDVQPFTPAYICQYLDFDIEAVRKALIKGPIQLVRNKYIAKSRNPRTLKKSCKRGHLFAGSNLYIAPDGIRGCRTCRNMWTRRKLAKKAAAL